MRRKIVRRGVTRAVVASPYFWLLVGCVLTVVAMLGYPYLPEKRLQLVNDDADAYIYADPKNSVEWLDMEALRWRCQIRDSHGEAFCGFNIVLGEDNSQGVDFSQYDRLNLDLSYSGASRSLRYYLRNREPGFSERDDPETHKFNQTQISVEFLPEGLSIGLDEFYVAEWWLSGFSVPRAISGPSFDHVTSFGIDLAYPAASGEHIAQLHGAELVGDWVSRDSWYAGIIISWVVVLTLFGSYRLYDLRQRVLLERRRAEKVAERNRELRQESQQYRELSEHDQLTGLLNRHGITREIEKFFALPENTIALLVIDIDHFKSVNDTHGHDIGDRILRQMGEVLSDSVRQSDRLARWGGEEFVLLLPESDGGVAQMVAEKLRQRVADTRFEALPEHSVTISIGVGVRQSGEDYHALFRRVDTALYRAKDGGRNRVELSVEG
ncbi:GGDEF domain-containing protein [Marinimicrobium agarilyticum]|uniref:GGDEF domain-containing protein n=1 Tax=Marinimicrobium agarilyticum TaxID=306546 RepID=UPI00146D12A5|nr:GGDEF domain-containing protein [Marinimicrobium agarilyticum]